MRRMATLLVLTVGFLSPVAAASQTAPTDCSIASQNLFVRDVLANQYLWYRFLPNPDPASFASPEAYLEAVRYRALDSSFSYITTSAQDEAYYNDSQYIGLGIATVVEDNVLRVVQVFDGSPAVEGGIRRGHRITEINGRTVAALIAAGEILKPYGRDQVGVEVDIVFETLTGEGKRAHLVKGIVTIPTVTLTKVFDVGGRKVGYLSFRNFVRPSYDALDEAFATLKAAGVTDLILDLRYNGGGLVDVAVHLSSLIGGSKTNGQPLVMFEYNDRRTASNRTFRFEDLPQALTLSRLFVIATHATASSSEIVVNALRPYMPVAIIGETTRGKPVGQNGYTFCEKVLLPVTVSFKNARGEGDYFAGFPPTCPAGDDLTHELGDPAESSLAEAIQYLRTGACGTRTLSQPATTRARDAQLRPAAAGFRELINAW